MKKESSFLEKVKESQITGKQRNGRNSVHSVAMTSLVTKHGLKTSISFSFLVDR